MLARTSALLDATGESLSSMVFDGSCFGEAQVDCNHSSSSSSFAPMVSSQSRSVGGDVYNINGLRPSDDMGSGVAQISAPARLIDFPAPQTLSVASSIEDIVDEDIVEECYDIVDDPHRAAEVGEERNLGRPDFCLLSSARYIGREDTGRAVDEPLPVDLEHMVQVLLAQEGFVDDPSPAGPLAETTAVHEPPPLISAAFGEMWRTGPLAAMNEDVQTALLGGTLYEYGDAENVASEVFDGSQDGAATLVQGEGAILAPPPATPAHDCDLQSETASATANSAATSALSRLLRMGLDRNFQLSHRERSNRADGSSRRCSRVSDSARGDGPDDGQMVGTARSVATPPEATPSEVASEDDDFAFRSNYNSYRDIGRSPVGSYGMARLDDVIEDESVVSVVGFGSPRSEVESGFWPRAASESFDESGSWLDGFADTVLGGTLARDGDPELELATVLRQLPVDQILLDESLSRSIRRVIQLGTVLTGQCLSDEEVHALPKVQFKSGEQQHCTICLETYRCGELLTKLRCDHFFHVDCLRKWLQRSTQCPLCRMSQD